MQTPVYSLENSFINEIRKSFKGKGIIPELKKKFPDVIFQLIPGQGTDGENDFYYMQMVLVPFDLREQGLGTKFMKELVKLAKKENTDIFLTPDSAYQEENGMTKNDLTKWYRSFGFRKKERSDFRYQATYCYYA